jgi:FKBP-type peptidyl-prolyl cis-trans isomerase FkpA
VTRTSSWLAAVCAAALLPWAATATPDAASEPRVERVAGGLESEDLEIGKGAEARPGSTVEVHYTGWLADGSVFDASRDRGRPLAFRLGAGMVIRGWDEGIVGMKVGGVRRLRIPPALGYGARGVEGSIPGNAHLVVEIELVAVR